MAVKHPNIAEFGNPSILAGVSGLPKSRPLWVAEEVPIAGATQMGRILTSFEQRYNLMYLDEDGPEGILRCREWISIVQDKLVTNNWRMTGLLIDFNYPSPAVFEDVGAGSLPIDTYYIAVAGLSFMDENEESLPSLIQTVTTTAANGRLEVIIPRFPRGFNWFKKYNVYVGTVITDLKKTADSPVDESLNPAPLVYNLDTVPAGSSPLVAPNQIKYRIMEVVKESFSSYVMPEPSVEAGNYMGLITLTIKAVHEPIVPQTYPIRNLSLAYNLI